jgi:hypothetical protein
MQMSYITSGEVALQEVKCLDTLVSCTLFLKKDIFFGSEKSSKKLWMQSTKKEGMLSMLHVKVICSQHNNAKDLHSLRMSI